MLAATLAVLPVQAAAAGPGLFGAKPGSTLGHVMEPTRSPVPYTATDVAPPASRATSVSLPTALPDGADAGALDGADANTAVLAAARKCRQMLRQRSLTYVAKKLQLLQRCFDKVGRGGSASPCPHDPLALDKLRRRLAVARLAARCPSDTVVSSMPAGMCAGAETTANLSNCVLAAADAAVANMLESEYADDDPTAAQPNPATAKCQERIGRALSSYQRIRLKRLAACQTEQDRRESHSCPDARTAGTLANRVARLGPKLAQACTAADLANLAATGGGFGGSCAGVTTTEALALCLVADHDAQTDTIFGLLGPLVPATPTQWVDDWVTAGALGAGTAEAYEPGTEWSVVSGVASLDTAAPFADGYGVVRLGYASATSVGPGGEPNTLLHHASGLGSGTYGYRGSYRTKLLFGYQDPDNYYFVEARRLYRAALGTTHAFALHQVVGGTETALASAGDFSLEADGIHEIWVDWDSAEGTISATLSVFEDTLVAGETELVATAGLDMAQIHTFAAGHFGVENRYGIREIDRLSFAEPSVANQAPEIATSGDLQVALPGVTLDADVTDDGRPAPPAFLSTRWAKVSGPGTVVFADATAVDSAVTFSSTGEYVLSLLADDGERSTSVTVNVEVHPLGWVQLYDTYGGSLAIEGTATGFFHLEQLGMRWMWVTPAGHGFVPLGVSIVGRQPEAWNGTDRLGLSHRDHCIQKYGSLQAWENATAERFRDWGFNYTGYYTLEGLTGLGIPTVKTLKLTTGAIDPRWAVAGNVWHGQGLNYRIPDVFNPAVAAYAASEMQRVDPSDDMILALYPDEPDELKGFMSYQAHLGLGILVGAMAIGAETDSGDTPFTNYSKLALVAFLEDRYGHSISALNQAWGTSFASFDDLRTITYASDWGDRYDPKRAGFPAYRQDLDDIVVVFAEKYARVVLDAVRSRDPNHAVGVQLYGSEAHPQVADGFTSAGGFDFYVSEFGADGYDLLGRPFTRVHYLQSNADSPLRFQGTVDEWEVTADPQGTIADPGGDYLKLRDSAADIWFELQFAGGRLPIQIGPFDITRPGVVNPGWGQVLYTGQDGGQGWFTVRPWDPYSCGTVQEWAQSLADLQSAGQNAEYVRSSALPEADYQTQEERGQAWADLVGELVTSTNAAGEYYVAGMEQWKWMDTGWTYWLEQVNFGLVTLRDNAYDGREATVSGADGILGTLDDEENDYGDAISPMRTANKAVYDAIIGESGW